MTQPATATPRPTPLERLHTELGGRMVPFAGYAMPLQYPAGVLKEHLHTRALAGLFDVSHMGQITLRPRSGALSDAAAALERLVPADILGLAEGRQRYTVLTADSGGILDDLMVANCGDRLALVVNAARKDADEAHLREYLSQSCIIERHDDAALLALQGPAAESVLARLAPEAAAMKFMEVRTVPLLGTDCEIARSGYTGEDGYEISIAAAAAEGLARELLKNPSVAPIGLGARDSLRLEAGLCLYGADLTSETSPVEAALEWSIQKSRRSGDRAGGFPGAATILAQLDNGVRRRRVGLQPQGRAPVRSGVALFDTEGNAAIGSVTSGGYGPSVNAPIAMGYVAAEFAQVGMVLHAEVRGNRMPVMVCDLPFIAPRYKRN